MRYLCAFTAVTLLICLASGPVSAAVLFEDDFNGTTLDASKWITSGTGTVTVSGGNVKLNVTSGNFTYSQIDSTSTWIASGGDLYFNFTIGAMPQGNYDIFQVFAGNAQVGYAAMRNDLGTGWVFDVREGAAGSAGYRSTLTQTMQVGDIFTIKLGPDGSAAYKNGAMFDHTSIVPSGQLMVDAQAWRAPDTAASQTFSYISVESDNYDPDPDPDPDPSKLVKLPDVLSYNTMECTPIIWKGQPYLFQSYRTTVTSPCDEYLAIKNLTTGVESAPFGYDYSLGCAYVNGNEINVFASKTSATDWFQDIYRFTSTDMVNWTTTLAIPRVNEHLLNSSVSTDPDGYIMAYESDNPVGFCFKFAHSTDLATWEKLDVPAFAGMSGGQYSACPMIRYNSADDYYYVIYLARGQGSYAGQFVSNIIRSRDLVNWQFSAENPVLAPSAGEGINNSDVDLFEYEGKTYVYYADGDQATWLELKHAVYDGPMSEFLQSYFPALIAGDANEDGIVDSQDAQALAENWLTSSGAKWYQGDFNDDGAVNDIDAMILATNWLKTSSGSAAVPEPSSLVLLLAGLAAAIWGKRLKNTFLR